jgi:uncharacterized membrane protein
MKTLVAYGLIILLLGLIVAIIAFDIWVYFRAQERIQKTSNWLIFYAILGASILLVIGGIILTVYGSHEETVGSVKSD